MSSNKLNMLKLAMTMAFFILALGYVLSERATYGVSLAQTARSKNPLQPTDKNVALGLDHFDAHCATCHGSTGKADTEKGRATGATDLTSEKVQAKSDTELFLAISRGVPGTAMPAFAKTHKPTEIWQTVLFLRKLPTLTAEERAKLETALPAGARHKHGGGHQHPDAQPHTHPEGQAHHEHAQPPAKPSTQQPSTEHQHETPRTQQEQKPAQPEAAHKHGKPPAPQPQQEHHHEMQPQTEKPGEMKQEMRGHDMSKMGEHGGHDMNAMMATITGGPFKSMTAIGSGTSLLPSSSPGYMWHWMKGDWMIMAHGDLKVGFNHQGGPRGVNKAESQNWFMLMGEREAGPGRLMLRGMFSAEPATAPRRGFPELFQTGETFKGRPIIDAQHPHDLLMELAAAYNIKLSENVALNFYGGPVGEPALGPVAFMHRMSAAENPAAPLGHHWQDSTHISHGVITAGMTAWRLRFESSLFRGAEPDETRWDIEMGKLDSWSGRIWFTPTPDWSMQFSYGHLVNPEAIEPGNLKRMTASVSHNRSWEDGNWATSLIWGRNHEHAGNSNSYLLESTANFLDNNYLYTRLELVDKPGLLEENIFGRRGLDQFQIVGGRVEPGPLFERFFRVGAFTFGGVRDIVADSKLRVGVGADVTFYHVPDGLKAIYGSSPTSFHVFLRIRPGKMHH
ncbi:MAG TPA: c-type cytochrome [Blastocatellia bacterium]|nr:c-type cytochrome [Blastocatellia bacterium]